MRLQTLQAGAGREPIVLTETPWHDDASAVGGAYRERLKQFLGGYFEADDKGMQPKAELLGGDHNPVPDAVRLVDDAGKVLETYTYQDLERDTGMTITMPTQSELGDD